MLASIVNFMLTPGVKFAVFNANFNNIFYNITTISFIYILYRDS
jgi:hypothetical protein